MFYRPDFGSLINLQFFRRYDARAWSSDAVETVISNIGPFEAHLGPLYV